MSAENWKHTFAVIWSGQAVSVLSSSIVAYAIIFWMSVETRSAEVLALSAMAGMLPQAVLGLFVGVYIDENWRCERGEALRGLAYGCSDRVLRKQ